MAATHLFRGGRTLKESVLDRTKTLQELCHSQSLLTMILYKPLVEVGKAEKSLHAAPLDSNTFR